MLLREFRDGIGWMCADGDDFLLATRAWALRLPNDHPFLSRISRGLLPTLPVQGEPDCVLVGDPEESSGAMPKAESFFEMFATAKDAIGLEPTPISAQDGRFRMRLLIAEDETPVWVDERFLRLIGCFDDDLADEVRLLRYRPESKAVLWATASKITAIVMPVCITDSFVLAVGKAAAAVVNQAVAE